MTKPRATLGEYLMDSEPVTSLWTDLVDVVYRVSPREAHVEYLSKPAQILFDVGSFQGEIINGGFSQFFSNSSGNRTQETLSGLRAIGATLCAQLLESAVALFPNANAPVDRQKRCELLFAFEESHADFLEQFDQEFYKRVDALGGVPDEDLTVLQLAFMRANNLAPVAV